MLGKGNIRQYVVVDHSFGLQQTAEINPNKTKTFSARTIATFNAQIYNRLVLSPSDWRVGRPGGREMPSFLMFWHTRHNTSGPNFLPCSEMMEGLI